MTASYDGHNARGPFCRPPSNSAFEDPLPRSRLWWFPRIGMVDLALARIASSLVEDWFGAHLCMIPLLPRKNWSGKLAPFERVILWPAGAALFAGRISGKLGEAPNVENARWAAFRITKNA